jgi:predicted RNA-binding protein with PUA-like domain
MNQFWLIKSEPECYSLSDLKRDKKTSWSGVRNYQARNFMKSMKVGDEVLFYHSGSPSPEIVGIASVSKEAHPDITALDPKNEHFDPKATKGKEIWEMVDVRYESTFSSPIPLSALKRYKELNGMLVTARGNRLSVMPVSKDHFAFIKKLGAQNAA